MKYFFAGLLFVFILSACEMFTKDDLKKTADDVRLQTEQAITKGKEAANEIKEGTLQIKQDIETKIDDIDQAMKEVSEAKQAIDRIFNSSVPDSIFSCSTDADCIVVEYEGCCTNKTSINKESLSQYNKNPSWRKDSVNCSSVECGEVPQSVVAKCVSNASGIKQCTVVGGE